jgi:hypothetical protein
MIVRGGQRVTPAVMRQRDERRFEGLPLSIDECLVAEDEETVGVAIAKKQLPIVVEVGLLRMLMQGDRPHWAIPWRAAYITSSICSNSLDNTSAYLTYRMHNEV